MGEELLTPAEFCRQVGVMYPTVVRWAQLGYITPKYIKKGENYNIHGYTKNDVKKMLQYKDLKHWEKLKIREEIRNDREKDGQLQQVDG